MTFYPNITYDSDNNIVLDGEGITVVGGDAANNYIGYYCEVDGQICVFAGCDIDREDLPEIGTVDPEISDGQYGYANWRVNTYAWSRTRGLRNEYYSTFYAFKNAPKNVNGRWNLNDAIILNTYPDIISNGMEYDVNPPNGYNWVIPIVASNGLYKFQESETNILNPDGVIMHVDEFMQHTTERSSGSTVTRHYAIGTLYYQANTYKWKFYTEISDESTDTGTLTISLKKGRL